MSLCRKTQSIHKCAITHAMGNAICAALLQISYHLQLSLTTAQRGSHFVWLSLNVPPFSMYDTFNTTFTTPHQTPVSHALVLSGPDWKCTFWSSDYDSHLPLRMFQTLLSNSYATCLPSFLSFSHTHIHTNAPKRPTWDKMRLIEEPISHLLPHPPCPHTHTCARSHTELVVQRWLYPELTKSARRENLVWTEKGKVNN